MDSRLREDCTCSRKLLVYGSIIPIYPALSKLEKKFMENTNKYENSNFHDTNIEKEKDTLKVGGRLEECKHKAIKKHVGGSSCEPRVWTHFQLGLSSVPSRSTLESSK